MGHVDGRRPPLAQQLREQSEQLAPQAHVEVRERLVEQHGIGLEDERAGDRHALPLAARQLARPAAGTRSEADTPEHGGDAGFALGAPDAARRESERQIPLDGEMRPQRQVLEHHREIPLLGRPQDPAAGAHHLAAQPDRSASGRDEAEHHPERGRLPGRRGAENRQHLTLRDVERQTREHLGSRLTQPHVLEGDPRDHRRRLRPRQTTPISRMDAVTTTWIRASAATTAGGPFASRVKMRTGSVSRPGG